MIKRKKILESDSSRKNPGLKWNLTPRKSFWIVAFILFLGIVFIALFFMMKKEPEVLYKQPIASIEWNNRISPLELVTNKEKYEMKKVTLLEAFIPSTSYIYVNGPQGFEEKLFIRPKNTQYCTYFNLEGYLKKDSDSAREWVFIVDRFECVRKR